jgi:hypothetical protein
MLEINHFSRYTLPHFYRCSQADFEIGGIFVMEVIEDNIAKLKNKFKMSDEVINKILFINEKTYSFQPIEISSFLTFMDDIDDIQRIYYIEDSLHSNIGISYETLAKKFCDLDTKELEEFLYNPESLSEKKKFVLAVRIMYLHFVLKEKLYC